MGYDIHKIVFKLKVLSYGIIHILHASHLTTSELYEGLDGYKNLKIQNLYSSSK